MGTKRTPKKVHVHMPYRLLKERLDFVLDEGINPEIYLDARHLDGDESASFAEIRRGLDERGLEATMHGPYIDLNPGALDEATRLQTEEAYALTFEAAAILRPASIVLHGGYREKSYRGDVGLWLERSMLTWQRFVREAERLGLTIAVENIFDRTPEALKALMDRVGSACFGVCIDAGHMNVFSKVRTAEWFRELGGRLAEVHLHDNRGESDEHMPIGTGTVDFKAFFEGVAGSAREPVYTIEPHGIEWIRPALDAVGPYLR